MSRDRLSFRQYRRLSAYLDNALPPAEAARVAQRLATDRRWQTAYEEMKAIKQGLASLPAASAPRRFTLSPAQAAAARHPTLPRTVYRWVSALALVLLLLMATGDWLTQSGLPSAAPTAEAPLVFQAAPETQKGVVAPTASTPPPLDTGPAALAPAPAAGEARPARSHNTPTASPASTSPPPPALPPAPPSRWPWRLAEGLLAALALGAAYLGWLHRR